jgi:adenine deaminase
MLGLLSQATHEFEVEKFDKAFRAITDLGCPLKSPFSQLEFCCACGEIGEIKLSEEGVMLINPPQKVEVIL